jgi:PHD/YefM family antitoxin component YafN of YafNO toxin-antitoxin module
MILARVGGKNVTERISTLQIRQRLGDILNRVALRNDQFIIERKGKPLAAMVPVERLGQMQQAARLHILSVLERQPGALSQADADRIATEAKHRTRRPRRK